MLGDTGNQQIGEINRDVILGSRKKMVEFMAKTNDFVSSRILLSFTRIQRTIPPSLRRRTLSYYEGLRFRSQSAHWSEEKKREWILDQLRFAVRRAHDETLYHRKLFKRD